MIIHGLWAENILKYERLNIDELPERGLFAISGENESGKSTIGETICFALFGRTFSLGRERIAKVIRWNQNRGKVEIDFTGRDGVRCRLERYIDLDGNHGARLTADGEEVAKGAGEVAEEVVERIGFGFDEFIESFYLAQREITAPHPHSHAVKVIAGVAPLEAVSDELADEIRREEERIAGIEQEIEEIELQIEALGIRENGLERLEQERLDRLEEEREQQALREEWEAVPDLTRESVVELEQAAQPLLGAAADTPYCRWGEHADALEKSLDALAEQYGEAEGAEEALEELRGVVSEVRDRRAAFDPVRDRIAEHRRELGLLLGEGEGGGPSLGERIAALGKGLRSMVRRRAVSRFTAMLTFLLGAGAGLGWWLLVLENSRAESEVLKAFLNTFVPGWEEAYLPWLPHAFGALLVVFIITWLRSMALSGRINRDGAEHASLEARLKAVRAEAEALDGIDRRAFPEAVDYLKSLEDEGIAAALPEFLEGPGAALLDDERLAELRERLTGRMQGFESVMVQLAETAVEEVAEIERGIVATRDAIVDVDQRIEEEKERRRQAEELRAVLGHFPPKIDKHREAIRLRELSRDLLAGAFRHTTQRFNREIRKLVATTLPRLTENRYEHLQIDEELKVRVFSNEKQDFLELDEISSGTQRQIMLAVRLALSQELVETAGLGHQFLFLDEPFAFFDMARMRSSLDVLPHLSDELRQIWVISQEFPKEVMFDIHAQCARKLTEVEVK